MAGEARSFVARQIAAGERMFHQLEGIYSNGFPEIHAVPFVEIALASAWVKRTTKTSSSWRC